MARKAHGLCPKCLIMSLPLTSELGSYPLSSVLPAPHAWWALSKCLLNDFVCMYTWCFTKP